MTYITEAHSRLLAGLVKTTPATIPLFPAADDFNAQAEHITELRGLLVEYLHALAAEGAHNATTNAINSEVTGYVSDALDDFAAQFRQEAESLREDELENA